MSDGAVVITRLGHLGDGIAEGPVYAARTLPGEVVDGAREGDRIPAPRILTPAPERIRPPCPHYRGCGGCALQHASDDFVLAWKEDVVRAALRAHGLGAPLRPSLVSPPASRRRARFTGRRTKTGTMVGFHGLRSESLVDVPDCQILTPALLAVRPALAALTRAGASRKTPLELAVTATETGCDVAVRGGKALDLPLQTALTEIGAAHDLARLSWAGELVALWRAPQLRLGRARVPVPPGAFLQATEHGQAALTEAVHEAVGGARQILDLFAGCGTFALPLAERAEIHAVEGDAALLDALSQGWRGAVGLKRVTCEARDLFRRPLLPKELARFEAAVIDPPRAGAEAQTAALARAGLPRIASVSCNPVSFARDAAMLVAAGYRLAWVQLVDQFRWSPHIELVAAFERAAPR